MKLSPNFSLDEFLVSQTAERHGIDMTPPGEVIDNLRRLCEGCLQPIRDALGPVYISSGYRPQELNQLIGGSLTSRHMSGDAADFRVAGMTPYEVCKRVEDMELPYDQLINEFDRWVHLGVADVLRGEELTAYRDGKTKYAFGIHRIEDLV